MNTMDDFSNRLLREAMRMRSFERKLELAEKEHLAVQAAIAEHPVVRYVKHLPVESPKYPAIEYHKVREQKRRSEKGEDPRDENDISYENVTGRPSSDLWAEDGSEGQEEEWCYREFIEWCMPGHDLTRPIEKNCGFIRSKFGKGIVYTACPNDDEHHIKGKRRHCWSLRCPQCMNDTALRKAISSERQLLTYRTLMQKRGQDPRDIGHWVVSPPQEFVKRAMQTRDIFDCLYTYVGESLARFGGSAGLSIFHPWRQRDDEWQLSPHFHVLSYGYIDTNAFRKYNPGWIIKKVHPRQKIRSIRHTVAYLLTHSGQGMSEKDPSDCDWDLKLMNYFIPGLCTPGADYKDEDYAKKGEDKGRMVGDLSGIDWLEWTKQELSKEIKVRYWGGVSRNNIRTLGQLRQYRIRVCQKCGALLRTYDGFSDPEGAYVRYIADQKVMMFAEDAALVRSEYLRYKDRLKAAGLNITDFAAMIPAAVSTLELDTPKNDDLVMDGPFQEPDEYFLKRQREAFGPDE